nr:phosphomevalonate kinase [Hymenolepis microstoma]
MDQNLSILPIAICKVNLLLEASSTSCEQVRNPIGVEDGLELLPYFEDVRFIAISGKRKSGKDYFANLLCKEIINRLGKTAAIIHISEPIKRAFAEKQNLDFTKLMSSSEYKEKFRRIMVRWGEVERRKDPTIFCRKALEYLMQDSPFKPTYLIIADCRRPSDLTFFSSFNTEIPLLHLRISASPTTRRSRGWIFFRGIDDAETECALDDTPFDILVINESERTFKLSMNVVIRAISGKPLRRIMTI